MHCKCLSLKSMLRSQRSSQLFKVLSSQCYSTKNAPTSEPGPSVSEHGFSMCHSKPKDHRPVDHLKMYPIPRDDARNQLVHALPKRFDEISQTVADYSMLLRKPSLKLIEQLEDNDDNDVTDTKKVLLFGEDGNGKRMCLLHVLHYCLSNNWCAVHVPSGGRFVDSQRRTPIQASVWKEQRYDQPMEASHWLKTFATMNTRLLSELKTSQSYKWGKRESTEAGKPLMDVVATGTGRNTFATDAVGVLLKELCLQNEVKLLFTVNEVNGFFSKTSHQFNRNKINLEELSLVHHFKKLLKHQKPNAAYVFSLSQSSQYSTKRVHPKNFDALLGEEGKELLGDFENVKVSGYTDEEYDTIMHYYKHRGWIARDLTAKVLSEIRFMTQKNPAMIAKFCAAI